MIDGLKLKVTAEELRTHCAGRADYHRKRATEKEEQLPKVRDALATLAPNQNPALLTHMNKVSTGYHLDPNDAVESLENDIRDHRNKALVFDFFGVHFFDEDYTLSESDLKRLEIIR